MYAVGRHEFELAMVVAWYAYELIVYARGPKKRK